MPRHTRPNRRTLAFRRQLLLAVSRCRVVFGAVLFRRLPALGDPPAPRPGRRSRAHLGCPSPRMAERAGLGTRSIVVDDGPRKRRRMRKAGRCLRGPKLHVRILSFAGRLDSQPASLIGLLVSFGLGPTVFAPGSRTAGSCITSHKMPASCSNLNGFGSMARNPCSR